LTHKYYRRKIYEIKGIVSTDAMEHPTVQVEYFQEDGGRYGKEKEAALQKE